MHPCAQCSDVQWVVLRVPGVMGWGGDVVVVLPHRGTPPVVLQWLTVGLTVGLQWAYSGSQCPTPGMSSFSLNFRVFMTRFRGVFKGCHRVGVFTVLFGKNLSNPWALQAQI